jgi:formamidopyrimidine-DNA glycosylase
VPEGPEVETVRRGLAERVVGQTLLRVQLSALSLRTPVTLPMFAALRGQTIVGVKRIGKVMWLAFETGAIVVRLGMTGRFTVESDAKPRLPHTHVRLTLESAVLHYVDPRRFGDVVPMTPSELTALTDTLGPDGLTMDDDGVAVVAASLRQTSRTLKDAILDQRVIAGVGNIYACEALFRACLSPWLRGDALTKAQATSLARAARDALQLGALHGGTSFSDYVDADGNRGNAQNHLLVFQHEDAPCPQCGTPVSRTAQSGRSTFHCSTCQRP